MLNKAKNLIKHIKNFSKYGVWKMTVFQKKYGTVLFGPCDDNNSREPLYKKPRQTFSVFNLPQV